MREVVVMPVNTQHIERHRTPGLAEQNCTQALAGQHRTPALAGQRNATKTHQLQYETSTQPAAHRQEDGTKH